MRFTVERVSVLGHVLAVDALGARRHRDDAGVLHCGVPEAIFFNMSSTPLEVSFGA
jgi:hypothetical protein